MDPWHFWFSVMWVPLVPLASDWLWQQPRTGMHSDCVVPSQHLLQCDNLPSPPRHSTTGEPLRYMQPLGLKTDSEMASQVVEVGQAGGW